MLFVVYITYNVVSSFADKNVKTKKEKITTKTKKIKLKKKKNNIMKT